MNLILLLLIANSFLHIKLKGSMWKHLALELYSFINGPCLHEKENAEMDTVVIKTGFSLL